MSTLLRASALALASLLFAACGGGGGGGLAAGGGAGPQMVQATSVPGRTGFNRSGIEGRTNEDPRVGDNEADESFQGFVSFSLDVLPAGATIESAMLVLPLTGRVGEPQNFGSLLVDAVDIDREGFPFVPQFTREPDATGSIERNVGASRVDVTSIVRGVVADARAFADFRLRLSLETDFDARYDLVRFAPPGDVAADANRLEITYR